VGAVSVARLRRWDHLQER